MTIDLIILGGLVAILALDWYRGRQIRDIQIVVGAMLYNMNKKKNNDT
jgi:hypothetical protein